MVNVNPKNLVWARETAGLKVDEAAAKLQYKDRQRRSAVERLQDYESGRDKPSHAQLRNMSAAYHQPLLSFYLSKPPPKADRGDDFRAAPESVDPRDNAQLDILIRNLKAAQNIVRDLLEDDEYPTVPLVNSASLSMGFERVAHHIVEGIDFRLQDFRGFNTHSEAFSHLRDLFQSKGIFVLLLSDLGSHQTAIPAHVFRGFTLADPIAPFIVINSRDAKVARPFTALHELTHVCLGSTGISGKIGESDHEMETFCDRVAGRILLPPSELQEISFIRQSDFESAITTISRFASKRHLSRTMVAYNLQKEGFITRSLSHSLFSRFEKDWAEQKAREKERQKFREGGPDYYRLKRSQIGRLLLDLAKRTLQAGDLTPSKAATVLGVKPRNVEPLLNFVQGKQRA